MKLSSDGSNVELIIMHHHHDESSSSSPSSSPSSQAVHSFMKQLLGSITSQPQLVLDKNNKSSGGGNDHHAHYCSFEIVVDNAQSGETAAKWHQQRRASLKRSLSNTSASTHSCRWSSDNGGGGGGGGNSDLDSSSTRSSSFQHHQLGMVIPQRPSQQEVLLVNRRNSSAPCLLALDQEYESDQASSTGSNITGPASPSGHRRRRSADSAFSFPAMHEDSPPIPPSRKTNDPHYQSPTTHDDVDDDDDDDPCWAVTDDDESESELSDNTIISNRHCNSRSRSRSSRRSNKKSTTSITPQTKDLSAEQGGDSDSALSLALIATIEKLSIRAALTLCRPQTSDVAKVSTMETIEEAMELLPLRGTATDISTTRRRRRPSLALLSSDSCYSGGEDSMSSLPSLDGSQAPEQRASRQQSDLNCAMLAAIDRLSVRAALTLTDESTKNTTTTHTSPYNSEQDA